MVWASPSALGRGKLEERLISIAELTSSHLLVRPTCQTSPSIRLMLATVAVASGRRSQDAYLSRRSRRLSRLFLDLSR